jgi:hypothetical protein
MSFIECLFLFPSLASLLWRIPPSALTQEERMNVLASLLCLVALSVAGPNYPPVSNYPGLLPADCVSSGTINVNGAFMATDGVSVLNPGHKCCKWNPLKSGKGAALASTSAVLHMQTTDDVIVATTDTLRDITVQLSGGDLAVRACLPAFSFTLLAGTADANGLLGLGGYFWSDGTAFIPTAYAPASVNYTALPLNFSPVSGRPKIYANFFTDGSVRLTGPQGVPIPTGTYNIQAACIIYNARKNPFPAPLNVRISDASCQSTIALTTTVQQNSRTLTNNYLEYFGLDYYNGVAYIVGNENCYPGSNNGSIWFNRTMLMSFYKLQNTVVGLTRLSYIPTMDTSLAPDSIAVLVHSFLTRPDHAGTVQTNQGEAGIAVSRQNANKMAVVWHSDQVPINFGSWQMGFSQNGGASWDLDSINLPAEVGVPGSVLTLPYPQVFQSVSWNCSHFSGSWRCPPLPSDTNFTTGTEQIAGYSLYPSSRGDNRMVVDAFDVFWQVGIHNTQSALFPDVKINHVVTFSLDYGLTWNLASDLSWINASAFNEDYDILAAGPDGEGGSQVCHAIKEIADANDFINFPTKNPIQLNCYHTSVRGIVDSITRVRVPGTEAGHYGDMVIGKDGTIYLNLQGMQTAAFDPTGEPVGTVGESPFGSSTLANAPILFTKCGASPEVVCQNSAQVIARVDYGAPCPNPQSFRCTWSEPRIAVDKFNNIYVLYYDAVRNPLPTAEAFFSFINTNQQTRILMIKSCDGGNTWSPPQPIHDDSVTSDPYSTPNIHFNLVVKYDPVSHTILASWMDTRIDPSAQTATQIYAAVITL